VGKLENPPIKSNKNKNRTFLLTAVIALFSLLMLFIDRWMSGVWRPPMVISMITVTVLGILIISFRRYVRKLLNKKRLNNLYKTIISFIVSIRYPLASILMVFFAIYTIFPTSSTVVLPSAIQFNIIVMSSTLGGLVLAGASNRRVTMRVYRELMSVAQKLIISTILLLVFAVTMFWVEATGGIDTHIHDFSREGIARGILFYASAVIFYVGVFMFSIGLIDLALCLEHIRKPKNQ
jgi:hypothetical protein